MSVLLGLIACLATQRTFTPLPDSVQLFTNVERAALEKRSWNDAWIFPDPKSVRILRSRAIPAAVRTQAAEWIRRVVAPAYLPRDVEARMVGVRSDRINDVIYLRYSTIADGKFQVMESESTVDIGLPYDSDQIAMSQDDVLDAVLPVLDKYLQLPAVPRSKIKASIAMPKPGFPFAQGILDRNPDDKSSPARAWHHRLTFFLGRHVIGVTIIKPLDPALGGGQGGNPREMRERPRGRFGNIGG